MALESWGGASRGACQLGCECFPVDVQRVKSGLLHPLWNGACPRHKACQGETGRGEWYPWRGGCKMSKSG